MGLHVQFCVLCGSGNVILQPAGRAVVIACRECLGLVRVELEPPESRSVEARIDVLLEPIRPKQPRFH